MSLVKDRTNTASVTETPYASSTRWLTAVSADVAVVAGCGDDRADDGGESHGEPRHGGGIAIEAPLPLVAANSHDCADVAVSTCPDVRQAGREYIERDQADGQYVVAADPGGGRQGASTEGEDRGSGGAMSPCRGLCHDVFSWSGMKMASTVSPKLRAMSSASGRDGR